MTLTRVIYMHYIITELANELQLAQFAFRCKFYYIITELANELQPPIIKIQNLILKQPFIYFKDVLSHKQFYMHEEHHLF